jgi:hypothetical protein
LETRHSRHRLTHRPTTGLIDKIIPDPRTRDAAKLALLKLQGSQDMETLRTQLSAIVAKTQSADPWTSHARPLYRDRAISIRWIGTIAGTGGRPSRRCSVVARYPLGWNRREAWDLRCQSRTTE